MPATESGRQQYSDRRSLSASVNATNTYRLKIKEKSLTGKNYLKMQLPTDNTIFIYTDFQYFKNVCYATCAFYAIFMLYIRALNVCQTSSHLFWFNFCNKHMCLIIVHEWTASHTLQSYSTGGKGVAPVSWRYWRKTSATFGPSSRKTSTTPLSENQWVSTWRCELQLSYASATQDSLSLHRIRTDI